MTEQVKGIIRHIVTLLAGFLTAFNVLDTELVTNAQEVIMQIVAVVGSIWAFVSSYLSKKKPQVGN